MLRKRQLKIKVSKAELADLQCKFPKGKISTALRDLALHRKPRMRDEDQEFEREKARQIARIHKGVAALANALQRGGYQSPEFDAIIAKIKATSLKHL